MQLNYPPGTSAAGISHSLSCVRFKLHHQTNHYKPLYKRTCVGAPRHQLSKGQLGVLNAESFCARVLSQANRIMTTGNSLLMDDELEMLALLRINREFMEFMRENYAHLSLQQFSCTTISEDDNRADLPHDLAEDLEDDAGLMEDIQRATSENLPVSRGGGDWQAES